jgi:PqqD family protein of HPr-rel-A system
VTDTGISPPGEHFWRITQGCELCWRSWNDEYVVYNSGSGDTHLLDLLSAEILKKIEEAPASSRALEDWVAGKVAVDSIPQISDYVSNLLLQLHSLALIEAVDA